MMRELCQKLGLSLLATFMLVLTGSVMAEESKVESMLKTADEYRLSMDAGKVVSEVSLYENGELDGTRVYHVYVKPDRRSLVVFKSAAEAGQKMLMLQDNYWLLMPKSRRPIRITPMQKLLGEASVGDVSSLTWSQDYTGELTGLSELDGKQVNTLVLEAKTRSASYQKIELYLETGSDFPIKADLYLKSGKLAKAAWFEKGIRDGKPSVTAMVLKDKIQPTRQTRISYLEVTEQELEDKLYNPAYLARTTISGL